MPRPGAVAGEPGRHTREQCPKLDLVMQLPRESDTLKVARLDRLSRSVLHLVTLGAELRERGIGPHVIERRPKSVFGPHVVLDPGKAI
ncbi:recombinase family protein [Streptomyces sp. NPDC056178]|uniref:recombinase family protein n=1 Tax=unclassified Streptomyces TaxID=2593676 RepID=UPI0035DB806B